MLDQTFSLSNLEEIYDEDNRRGGNRDARYFPSVRRASNVLSAKSRALRAFRKRYRHLSVYPESVQRRHDVLVQNLNRQKRRREVAIEVALRKVSEQINHKSFRITLHHTIAKGKPTYPCEDTAANYYAIRQINRNIRHLYKTAPGDRNLIISQLNNFLSDGYNYRVLRTDIKSFFDNINHTNLIEKIKKDQLLSPKSIKIIKQILWDYSVANGTSGQGVPRGLAISSDLSELYMKPIDRSIRDMKEVVYYGRFVDDIIVLAAGTKQHPIFDLESRIKSIMDLSGLTLNPIKTFEFNRRENKTLTYLGYQVRLKNKYAEIDISVSKRKKIEKRIYCAFNAYEKHRHTNSKRAYRLLLKRIAFLTGNTRLSNNKSNVLVGTYYSSPHLNTDKSLKGLDSLLTHHRSQITSVSLQAKLARYSFVRGRTERTFHKFNRKRSPMLEDEFKQIVRAWKNVV